MTPTEKLLTAMFCFLITVAMAFASIGEMERTETPPLIKLTLNQPGCELINRSGIPADIQNGICTITVRYRQYRMSDGGTIEKNGNVLMAISSGQVISFSQLDDGSDEPWSESHKQAFEWLVGSVLFMITVLIALSFVKDEEEIIAKQKRNESVNDLKQRLAAIIENDINNEGEDAIILKYMATRLKGRGIGQFGEHLQQLGARLFVRFPDGREVELPIPGLPNDYLKEIE